MPKQSCYIRPFGRTNTWLSSKCFHCQWTSSDWWHKHQVSHTRKCLFQLRNINPSKNIVVLENSFNWACGTHHYLGTFNAMVMSAPCNHRPQGRMWMSRFLAAFGSSTNISRYLESRFSLMQALANMADARECPPPCYSQGIWHVWISGYLKLLVSQQECKNPKGVARDHKEITG